MVPRFLSALLTLCPLLQLASSQSFDLSFTRSDNNLITLRCEHASNGSLLSDPAFFRDGESFELPFRQESSNGVVFMITRSAEGEFECAQEASAGPLQRSLSRQRIVALPSRMLPVIRARTEFEYMDGDRARLDCPITPGRLSSQYYITWRNAAKPTMTFYKKTSPNLSSTNFSFSDRYSIDVRNFSLFISEVTPGDMRFEYQCVLGVEDPQMPTAQIEYEVVARINLSLSILKSPKFIAPLPQNQLVLSGNDVTFTCTVLSSPSHTAIQWWHGGEVVDHTPNDRYSVTTTHVPNSNQEEGGVVTTSRFRIFDVDGFDSDTVQCRATYGTESIHKEVILSVLDTVQVSVLSLKDGGFIVKVQPKRRLLDPVALRLTFTDTRNSSSSRTRTTLTHYSDVEVINHVLSILDIPPYNTFTLTVALVQGRTIGPAKSLSTHFNRRPPLSTIKIGLIIVSSVLGMLVVIIISTTTALIYICRRYSKGHREVIYACSMSMVQQARSKASQSRLMKKARSNDSPKEEHEVDMSINGFNKSGARKFVQGIETCLKFGKNDELIKPLIECEEFLQLVWSAPTEEEGDSREEVENEIKV